MIQCDLSISFFPFSPSLFRAVFAVPSLLTHAFSHTPIHTHTHTQSTQPWKTQSAFWAGSLANELSYWNRKESALYCRNCCYGKPYRRGTGGKLLVRTKKHKNVLSLQMYQFTFIRGRLHPFLLYFIVMFFTTFISHLIIIHKTPLSGATAVRGRTKKNPIQELYFFPHWFSILPLLPHWFEHS